MKHELRIDTPDGFRETTPIHGNCYVLSFVLIQKERTKEKIKTYEKYG
jgi:hypothetical protein